MYKRVVLIIEHFEIDIVPEEAPPIHKELEATSGTLQDQLV